MAQLSDIQTLLDTHFGKPLMDLKDDLIKEMGQLIDTKLDARLKQQQDQLMGEIRKLQERTAALESRADDGGVGTKRARSEGPGYRAARADDPDNKVLVLKGFPFSIWSKAPVKHAETVFQSLSPNTPLAVRSLPQATLASSSTTLLRRRPSSMEATRADPRITLGSESVPPPLQWRSRDG